ncbi:MAG: hypothetical protein ACRDSL_25640 [Pseudonocardiaceae bacterium]
MIELPTPEGETATIIVMHRAAVAASISGMAANVRQVHGQAKPYQVRRDDLQ